MVSFCFVGDSSLQAFGRECLFRGSLAENFVTYFLVVISLRLLGKHFLFRYFFEKKNSSKFVWTGITLLRFSVRISLKGIFGSDFSSNIFGTYFLFRVFV